MMTTRKKIATAASLPTSIPGNIYIKKNCMYCISLSFIYLFIHSSKHSRDIRTKMT